MGASVFDRGERRPITQLKGVSGLLEIGSGKIVQMQAIARGEYQMIESAMLRKEGCNSSFVRDVNCLPLCVSTDGCNCFLNSFRTARRDNDARSLPSRLLGHCQTNPRRTAQHDHPLLLQTVSSLH